MKVYLIDSRDVLPFLDSEVSAALTEAMRRNGIHLHCGERVAECNRSGPEIRLMLQSGSVVRTEAVLVAAGRRSNTKYLNLAAAGLSSGERGDLIVDQHYRTAVPHIYAAGDVIGFPGLASTSMQQARRAMRVAFGAADDLPVRDIMPSAVYTIPEVAMVGDTEQAVREAGIDYVIGSARYSDNPRGCIIGEKEGFLKLILRRKDLKLLGVHAIGELASELVHIGLIAMSAGCDASVFSDLSFNVPTLGALYQDATWRLLNESRGVQTLPMPPAPNRRRALPGTTRIETAFPHPRTRGGCCWRELPNAKRDKTIQLSPGNPGARHSVFVLKAGFVT
jgi:NAD(P) transhydrogenase